MHKCMAIYQKLTSKCQPAVMQTHTHTHSGAHESIMYAAHAIRNNILKMSAQIPVMKMYDVSPLKKLFH